MLEIKQSVIKFTSNESYNGVIYSANCVYLIQDIPRGYISKWKTYGHIELSDAECKDIDVREDVRSKEYIKAEYEAMIKNENELAEKIKRDSIKKNNIIEEKPALTESIETEVENLVENEAEPENEIEVQEKPTRGRRRKNISQAE